MKAKKIISLLLASVLFFQIADRDMGTSQVQAAVTTENVNHVLSASMTCHTKEVNSFGADKANDGDVSTRWSSDYTAPEGQWLKAEFSEVTSIQHIKIKLFTRDVNPTPSNVASLSVKYTDEQGNEHYIQKDYANATSGNGYGTDISIELPEAVEAKSIMVCEFSASAEEYNNIGIAELEAYSNVIPEGAILDVTQGVAKLQETLEQLEETQKVIAADTNTFPMPELEELNHFQISLNGADFQQIVGADGSIVHPLTDKIVKVSFKITDNQGKSEVTKDFSYTVKGKYTQESNKNQKPQVIPEIAEWYSDTTQSLAVSSLTAVTYTDNNLEAAVQEFVSDYADFTGVTLEVVKGEPRANAINFQKQAPDTLLGEEGYTMEITSDRILVKSESIIGNIYGMQTILQMYRQNPESFAQGQMRDYPRFAVRGLLLDIARKPIGMDMIGEIARTMRYYKMNDLQLHVSDNYIWLEDYGHGATETEAFKAYEAFRLESSLTNAQGETPTAKDYYITKEEMQNFITQQRSLGMTIVPEIDIPAHATSFTKVWPELMLVNQTATSLGSPTRPLVDHFDISKPEAVEKIKEIFDDYTKGENPTFDSETIVHIGADEFVHSATAYRNLLNVLVPYVKETNTVRMWGGLTKLDDGTTEIIPGAVENVQMNLWSADWSDGIAMYEMGYDLINTIDNYGYMVPNGNLTRSNAYGDLLNVTRIFTEFEPNRVRRRGGSYEYVPSGDDQMLGAVFAIWSDNIDKRASGLSESDLYYRFFDALPFYAEKTWAATGQEKGNADALLAMAQEMGTGPNVNPYFQEEKEGSSYLEYEFDNTEDSSANNRDFQQETAEVEDGSLVLEGENSYISTPIQKLGNGNALSFDVTLTKMPKAGEILFETTPEYGTHDIRIMEDGRLGFTRELYDYSFDYKLPVGKKVRVKIIAQQQETILYIDGKLVGKATGKFVHNGVVKKENISHATFALPLERIGSKTNAITGKIDHVVVEEVQDSGVTYQKDQWQGSADTQTVLPDTNASKDVEGKIEYAYDDNLVSRWHSNWQGTQDKLTGENQFTVELDFGRNYTINQFSFTPRQDGNNSGCITKADLYVKAHGADEWILVAENKAFAPNNDTKNIVFEEQQVGHIKFVAKASNDGWVAVSEFDIASVLNDKCMVYVEAEGNGSVEGITEVFSQEVVTVTAQPKEGESFFGWYDVAGNKVSEEETYEFTVTDNIALLAKFSENVSETPGEGGEVPEGEKPGEGGEVPEGEKPGEGGEVPEGEKPGETPGAGGNVPEGQKPGETPNKGGDTTKEEISGGNSSQIGGSTTTPNVPKPEDTTSKEEGISIGNTLVVGNGRYEVTAINQVSYLGQAGKEQGKITIPATISYKNKTLQVTAIGAKAFQRNKKLTSVTIGKFVKEIGKSAFEGCIKLKTLKIGKSTAVIGAKAFKGCKSLKTVTIPKNVTTMGKEAFRDCKGLKTIKITGKKLKKVQKNVFKGISQKAKIKVPKKQLSVYKKILKKKGQSSKVQITR